MTEDQPLRQLALLAIERVHHCEARGRSHRAAALVWRRTGVTLSVVTALLATAGAASVPATSRWPATAFGLAAATLGAVTGALTPATRASKHSEAATAYRSLRTRLVDYLSLDVFASNTELRSEMGVDEFTGLRRRYERFSSETNTPWTRPRLT
jgi:hypothetical protein